MEFSHAVTPLVGLPFVDADEVPLDAEVVVLGAPTSGGNAHDGAENGPYFLRTLSKTHTWSAAHPAVVDLASGRRVTDGVVDLGDLRLQELPLTDALADIRDAVGKLPPGAVPCTIGGDHSVTLPVVQALAERRSEPFSVVQFDHHLDLQTWDGAPGDPAAPRAEIFNTNVMSHVSDIVGKGRLIQVGVDPLATVESHCTDAVGAFLGRIGIQLPLTSPALSNDDLFDRALGEPGDVYVTVDVDVLGDHEMSSTGCPAPVGLSTRELLHMLSLICRRHQVIGFDVVEFGAAREARDRKTLADAGRALAIVMHMLSLVSTRR
jgi:arginase family enzyme